VPALLRLKAWALRLRRDGLVLWFALRHPRTPWSAKALAVFVVAYALSPIDLIPDFIPVLGLLDEAILLPGLIWLALRLLPADVLADCRTAADQRIAAGEGRPRSWAGAALIVLLWLVLAYALWRWWPG
jgi:uncharacterized membrane protein YkvA (DUF1232 family)